MAEKQYRTVIGVVQFEPREGEAGDKQVRNITVRTAGFRENSIKVGATLWPSHDHVEVDKGDVVVMEGSFTRNVGEKDGEQITYNNLSVSAITVLGTVDAGFRDDDDDDESAEDPPAKKKATTKKKASTKKKPAEVEPEDDDDIPF